MRDCVLAINGNNDNNFVAFKAFSISLFGNKYNVKSLNRNEKKEKKMPHIFFVIIFFFVQFFSFCLLSKIYELETVGCSISIAIDECVLGIRQYGN